MSEAHENAALMALLRDLPGYTPGLDPREGGVARAPMQSFARMAGMIDEKLELLPERQWLAGLDGLGLQLLSAQSARVPLVFALDPEAPADVTLPSGSQVAAKPRPAPPTLDASAAASAEPVLFSTERAVTLTPARLVCLYSVDPGTDRFADHSANATTGFALFEALDLTPHHLYVAHDTLFNLGGHINLIFSFALRTASDAPMSIVWEYFTDAGWLPLPHLPEDDTTSGLTTNGQFVLRHECGPNARKLRIMGRESYWLRARLATPLLHEGIAPLVRVNDIRVRAAFGKKDLLPDSAFADSQSLDVSKDFYPFGRIPVLASSLVIACKDAFARPGAAVTLRFNLTHAGSSPTGSTQLALTWEYTTDRGWAPLTLNAADKPFTFEASREVSFPCPPDWVERDINGEKQRWLRVRISAGSYGQLPQVTSVVEGVPKFGLATLDPPIVRDLRIGFEYMTDLETLDHCVTYNDFIHVDVTEAARWPDRDFVPYSPIADTDYAVHLGFDRALPRGLVSLFLDVPESAEAERPSPYTWEYLAADGWRELSVLDETGGFERRGMIQFIGPEDAVPAEGFGDRPLYRLRARVRRGEQRTGGRCSGLWLNAAWATHLVRQEREVVGRSDGNPGQSFQVRRTPVLAGEQVEVEEWVGRGEGWRLALPEVPEQNIRLVRDAATREVVAAWVRWRKRAHFFDSAPHERHYVLERATGTVRFGKHVPAAGRSIAVSYASGGGLSGNVSVGAARELRVAVAYLNGARNVIAARGGAERESMLAIARRAPQRLRHRDRGISAQDIEWVALEASAEVARVRCMPLMGPDGCAQRGWYTLLVVPASSEARPELNSELARRVREHVLARMTAGARLRITGPTYASIGVRAIVEPLFASEAASVAERLRGALNEFLHPLRGGRDGQGWNFGEPVFLSHVAAVIAATEGVEHAQSIALSRDGVLGDLELAVPRDRLVASGAHELSLRVGAR